MGTLVLDNKQIVKMLNLLSILLLPFIVSGSCILEPDEENVVSSQLEGGWEITWDINSNLSPGDDNWGTKRIEIQRDDSVVDLMQNVEDYFSCDNMEASGQKIYWTGWYIIENKYGIEVVPIFLTTYGGNPFLAFLLNNTGELPIFAEGGRVMMARAVDRKNDIMFLENERMPFIAYKRVENATNTY